MKWAIIFTIIIYPHAQIQDLASRNPFQLARVESKEILHFLPQ